jgi:hypothetical protein
MDLLNSRSGILMDMDDAHPSELAGEKLRVAAWVERRATSTRIFKGCLSMP